MLLAVDVGNTQTHLGVFDSDKLIHEWRAATEPRRSADELALMFGEFLALAGMSFNEDVEGLAVCSVVPRATQELRDLGSRYLDLEALVVEPGIKTGVAIKTDNPREIGADRIADVVGAREIFPEGPVIVVDFGTAIKVEAISADGEFLGGAIAPGIDTAATALFSATAQLRRVELVAPATAIDRVANELGGSPKVVATGGLAPVVADHCRRIDLVEPILTLMGLRLIFERNAI
jgi:type III pantothenate kinase